MVRRLARFATVVGTALNMLVMTCGAGGPHRPPLPASGREVSTHVRRGERELAGGDLDRAIGDFTAVIRLRSRCAGGYKRRGLAFIRRGDFDRAIADFGRAIQLEPGDAEASEGRALARTGAGDHDGAYADYAVARSTKPDSVLGRFNREYGYLWKRDFERAVDALGRAIVGKPDFEGACAKSRAAEHVMPDHRSLAPGTLPNPVRGPPSRSRNSALPPDATSTAIGTDRNHK